MDLIHVHFVSGGIHKKTVTIYVFSPNLGFTKSFDGVLIRLQIFDLRMF